MSKVRKYVPYMRSIVSKTLILSAAVHISQIPVYGMQGKLKGKAGLVTVGSSLFGVAYAGIAKQVSERKPGALESAMILPTIGGTSGVWRYLTIQKNPFSVINPILDCILVPSAAVLASYNEQNNDTL